MRTIVDLITTKFRISLTWRKSKLTQKKRSRQKKKRKKKIRNRRLFVLRRSRRSKRLWLRIANASEMKLLMKRKMKMMFLRCLLVRVKRVKIVWEFRLLFSFVLFLYSNWISFICSDSVWSRVYALNDNQRDICMTRSY